MDASLRDDVDELGLVVAAVVFFQHVSDAAVSIFYLHSFIRFRWIIIIRKTKNKSSSTSGWQPWWTIGFCSIIWKKEESAKYSIAWRTNDVGFQLLSSRPSSSLNRSMISSVDIDEDE